MKGLSIFIMFFVGGAFLVFGFTIFAYQTQDLTDVPIRGDFVLGPSKSEFLLGAGEKFIQQLAITNRLGKTMDFKIEIEDFSGSYDPEKTVVLLGAERGPYSLRDYLKPEVTEFTLSHGQRILLPVEISVSADAEPGGLYGAVLVSTNPPSVDGGGEAERAKGAVRTIARLGSLFFVRIKGEVEEKGFLKDFKLVNAPKFFYEKGPVSFELLFQNDGSVHLVPYGLIEISNYFGKKVGEIEIDPYFAMPNSLRSRELKWEKRWLFGRYTATASINRGYDNIIDKKSLAFWVIPWKIILAGFVGLIIIIWFLRWMAGHFEIRIRRRTPGGV